MTLSIYLAPGEPRCTGLHCKTVQPCARHLAPYTMGRPVCDYSLPSHQLWVPVECCGPKWAKRILLSDAVAPAAKQVAKDWIGGPN